MASPRGAWGLGVQRLPPDGSCVCVGPPHDLSSCPQHASGRNKRQLPALPCWGHTSRTTYLSASEVSKRRTQGWGKVLGNPGCSARYRVCGWSSLCSPRQDPLAPLLWGRSRAQGSFLLFPLPPDSQTPICAGPMGAAPSLLETGQALPPVSAEHPDNVLLYLTHVLRSHSPERRGTTSPSSRGCP